MPAPTIDQLELADDPAHWAALGFALAGDECQIGAVRLRFADVDGSSRSAGILGWSLRDVLGVELDGLPTTISQEPARARAQAATPPVHPNGVAAIDHVVAISPDLDRSVGALRAAGLDLRRVREQPTPAGAPRQAFFRVGEAILELVQEPAAVIEREGGTQRPARFWGLALVVEDLERSVAALAPHAGETRAAVQPGRRIASVRRSAGLAVPLALMSRDERRRGDAPDRQDLRDQHDAGDDR
jgi:hypothetical protein